MNKKIKKARIILISLLILLVLTWVAVGIYYLFFKDDEVKYEEPKLTITSGEVLDLYEKISDLYLCETRISFDPFKENENKVIVKEMDQDLRLLLIFRQLELDGLLYNTGDVVTISLKQFEDASMEIFGYVPPINQELSAEGEYVYQFFKFTFVDNNYVGTKIPLGCEASFPVKRSELVGLKETDNGLTLNVETYEISHEQYIENELNNPENSIENFILENKGNLVKKTYKYNFDKKDDNYYLSSIER